MLLRISSMKLNVITSNEYLAEIIIKNDIEQLLIKYKHENNIDEQKKTAKQMNHINLFVTCQDVQINMLFFKTYLFIKRGII